MSKNTIVQHAATVMMGVSTEVVKEVTHQPDHIRISRISIRGIQIHATHHTITGEGTHTDIRLTTSTLQATNKSNQNDMIAYDHMQQDYSLFI